MNEIQNQIEKIDLLDKEIVDLKETIADKLLDLEGKRKEEADKLNNLVLSEAEAELGDKDYGCGTANIDTEFARFKVVVRKKVKWDENYIKNNIEPLIRGAGRDPEEYITYKRSVHERSYNTMDENTRKVFEAARSVEPSAPTITYERKV